MVVLQNFVEIIEKIISVVGIVFPGIFAIKYDADNWILVGGRIPANIFSECTRCSAASRPTISNTQADHVRKSLIAEEAGNAFRPPFKPIRPVKITVPFWQRAAWKRFAQAVGEHPFAACAPVAVLLSPEFPIADLKWRPRPAIPRWA